jgi:hypothetical protein
MLRVIGVTVALATAASLFIAVIDESKAAVAIPGGPCSHTQVIENNQVVNKHLCARNTRTDCFLAERTRPNSTAAVKKLICPLLIGDGTATTACKTAGWKSVSHSNPAQLTFRNLTPDSIQIYWIDYEGGLKFYQTVAPGGQLGMNTFITHPWVVLGAHGECLGAFVTSGSGVVDIN